MRQVVIVSLMSLPTLGIGASQLTTQLLPDASDGLVDEIERLVGEAC